MRLDWWTRVARESDGWSDALIFDPGMRDWTIYIARFTFGHEEEEEAWSAGKNGRQLVATVIRFDTCYAWYEGMEFFFSPEISFDRIFSMLRWRENFIERIFITFVSN